MLVKFQCLNNNNTHHLFKKSKLMKGKNPGIIKLTVNGARILSLLSERQYSFSDNTGAIEKLLFCHHERRRKANNISVSRLGKKPVIFKLNTYIPRS